MATAMAGGEESLQQQASQTCSNSGTLEVLVGHSAPGVSLMEPVAAPSPVCNSSRHEEANTQITCNEQQKRGVGRLLAGLGQRKSRSSAGLEHSAEWGSQGGRQAGNR